MSPIHYTAMPSADAEHFWNGGTDAYDRAPELKTSDGPGHPCRHCLENIDAGDALLVLAYRPFPSLQPYAETGPIFLHAERCQRYACEETLPPILSSPDYIVRGYGHDDRIVYGSGAVTPTGDITSRADSLLSRNDIAYVHVRSARNNCYQCRIERAEDLTGA
ncbi:DUF1203 domain-containing protein [Aliirhizobium terrae]|uniref:DUF1203 domain-containing protein n=1 Tax=Terrirhizobium terrae TaxID=2926709 RepID=UPI002577FCD3|nr:DUF1203 domain-containing protein [Rhizobium sp. CC-CFT758]WJH42314.1 DUF1203 domain-containing protein [Rhizobium sp. CC-CFT758]